MTGEEPIPTLKPRLKFNRTAERNENAKPHEELPNQIDESVRARWVDTRMLGDTLELLDKHNNPLIRIPYNEANEKHYMEGPENNLFAVEQRQLKLINEARRQRGEPEIGSIEELQKEQKLERSARREERSLGLPPQDGTRTERKKIPDPEEADRAPGPHDLAPRQDETMTKEELRERRKKMKEDLTQRYGRGEGVPDTKGQAWIDPTNDVAHLVAGSGAEITLPVGGTYNFGNRDNPVYKKWGGTSVGWSDAGPLDVERSRLKKGSRLGNKKENIRQGEADDLEAQYRHPKDSPEDFREEMEKKNVANSPDPEPQSPYRAQPAQSQQVRNQEQSPRRMPATSVGTLPPQANADIYGNVPRFMRRYVSGYAPKLDPAVRKESAPSMAEITRDPKKFENFKLFLASYDALDLLEKHKLSLEDPSAMTPYDEQELYDARKEFFHRSMLATEVRAGIRGDEMYQMLASNPSLKFILNSVSAERADALVRQNLERIFMQSTPEQVDVMVYAQRAIRDIRASKQYHGFNQRIREYLGRGARIENLDWDALDPTTYRRITSPSFFAGFGHSRLKYEETLGAIGDNNTTIMNILAATISRDVELRKKVIAEAYVPEKKTAEAHDPHTTEEHPAEHTEVEEPKELSVDDVVHNVDDYKKKHQRDWKTWTPEQRRQNYEQDYQRDSKIVKEKNKRFGGIFYAIIMAFFNNSKVKEDPKYKEAFAH